MNDVKMNDETLVKWNNYVEIVSCPFISLDDFRQTKKGISISKPLLNSGWNFYVQKKEDNGTYGVKITGKGTHVFLYSVATLEEVNLLFEDISEVVMLLNKTYGYSKLKEVFEYFKEDKKYSIRPKKYSARSDDGKIEVVVRPKGAEGYLPVVVDYEKGTNDLKKHNSICSACATFEEAKLKCEEVLEQYNAEGCYIRDASYRKFILEHECVPTVEKSKITVELTQEQYELLENILNGVK